jgi:hypothetical protein
MTIGTYWFDKIRVFIPPILISLLFSPRCLFFYHEGGSTDFSERLVALYLITWRHITELRNLEEHFAYGSSHILKGSQEYEVRMGH